MTKKTFLTLISAAIMAISCGGEKTEDANKTLLIDDSLATSLLNGDSTLYGLACDGCNDSVVVFLKGDGSDPVKYDILEATRNHKVFGRPRIGDRVALIMNPEQPDVCDMLINIERLRGTWCYMVEPTINQRVGMTDKQQQRMIENMPDSVKQKYLQPREYGITFKSEWVASAVYDRSVLDNKSSFVSYPEPRHYSGWHILNGKLVLTRTAQMRIANVDDNEVLHDTIDLVSLRRDSLVLRIDGKELGFYRKEQKN